MRLLWKDGGAEIRAYRLSRGQSARLPGEAHYFKSGLTYSYIGTRGFRARLLSADSVFDIASSAVFSEKTDLLYILGFLNSALARFVLGILNPTVNFQIGDIRRIPFLMPEQSVESSVSHLVSQAIAIAKTLETFDRNSPMFNQPLLERYRNMHPDQSFAEHAQLLIALNSQERLIQQQIDQIIFDLYAISDGARQEIYADPWVSRDQQKFMRMPTEKDHQKHLQLSGQLS